MTQKKQVLCDLQVLFPISNCQTPGEKSFDAMLKFARDCKQYLDDVRFTVVDVIGEEKVEQSKILAAQNGIPLRVRKYSP